MRFKLSCYDTVLYTLLYFNYATRKTLLVLDFSDVAIYAAIKKGIQEKTISESSIRYRRGKGERHHVLTYLTITAKGIRYLAANCGRVVPWLCYLPNNICHVRIRGVRCTMTQVEGFTRMSAAAQLASAIGAYVEPLYLTPANIDVKAERPGSGESEDLLIEDSWWLMEDAESTDAAMAAEELGTSDDIGTDDSGNQGALLSEIVLEAMRRAEAGNSIKKENRGLCFQTSRTLKSLLGGSVQGSNKNSLARDLMMCRNSGLLESCSNSVLVYVAGAMGMDWRERIVRKELAMQSAYAKMFSSFGPIRHDARHGVLVVSNEKTLADLYHDKQKRRTEGERIGDYFDHFWVVPLDANGKDDLRQIMTSDLEADREALIDAAVNSGIYERNFRLSPTLFPLVNHDGLLVADGTLMDLVMVNSIESLSKRMPDMRYGVLCRPNQLPYYQRIMPQASFMLMQ